MSAIPRRLLALPLAVAATTLFAASANAAMGGANALTTSLRPDLRSATVQSTNAADDTTTVRVCFSKAIASLPQAALFQMGSYDADDAFDAIDAVSATRGTSNCADVVFPNDDATQFTYVTVFGSDGTAPDSGSSAVSTNGFGNIQDSTALIGSKTNNGTRGFTTGPDLVGITVNNAQATIDFTFDQRVAPASISTAAADFSYQTKTGASTDSIAGAANRALSTDGLTVRVNFPPGPAIQDAVRAFIAEGAVGSKADNNANMERSAVRPGSGGFTDAPDLVAIIPSASGSSVDYQFDQVLNAIPGGPGAFEMHTSFSVPRIPASASIAGGPGVGNTVRAVFTPAGEQENEYWVSGSADAGAVTGVGPPSTPGGLPAGGNAGAFATGFTVGPEALTVSFDNATDVAHVLFDQRWQDADETEFKLLDDQGSQISAAALNVSGGGSPTAGRVTADVTFPAGTVAGARSLLLQQNAVEVDVTLFGPLGNRPQVISPTAPAATKAKGFRSLRALRRAAKRR
jgi:hypothetical protein